MILTWMRGAARNPIGLGMVGSSAAAAALTATSPLLEPWSERALFVLLLGIAGYAGTIGIYRWPLRQVPEVREVRKLRDAMATLLAGRQGSPLAATLGDAIYRLDEDMLPAIAQLVAQNQALKGSLERFTRGELIAPDREALSRLQAIESRQRKAITMTRQQVANAYAATLAISQQSAFDDHVLADAERWSRELSETQTALTEVLDESAYWERRLEERHP